MRRWLLCGCMLWGLMACLQNTDVVDPNRLRIDRESRPVVICFISPQDTVLAAKVAMSEPQIISNVLNTRVVTNASVTISQGDQSTTLLYDPALEFYRARPSTTFRIEAGKTYTLTVSMGEDRRVTALATIPPALPIDNVTIDSTTTRNGLGEALTTYTTVLRWNSPGSVGGARFYRGWGEFTQHVVDSGGRVLDTRVSNPTFGVDRESGLGPGLRLLSGTHQLRTTNGQRIRTVRAKIALFTTDENYYRYHASLRDQLNSPNSYFAESTVLLTNINGGYGVFAGYNATYWQPAQLTVRGR